MLSISAFMLLLFWLWSETMKEIAHWYFWEVQKKPKLLSASLVAWCIWIIIREVFMFLRVRDSQMWVTWNHKSETSTEGGFGKKQGGTNNLWIRTKEHYPECLEKCSYSVPHWEAFLIGKTHWEFQFNWTSETLCHSASAQDTLLSTLL